MSTIAEDSGNSMRKIMNLEGIHKEKKIMNLELEIQNLLVFQKSQQSQNLDYKMMITIFRSVYFLSKSALSVTSWTVTLAR